MQLVKNNSMKVIIFATALFASFAVHAQDPSPITSTDVDSLFTDPAGRTTEFETGAFGEVLGTVDTAGLSSTVGRDADGNPTSATLPDGSATIQTFDLRGNSTSRMDRTLGGTFNTIYDAQFSQITQVTDALFAITSVAYDSAGNPVQLTTPEGRILSATYTPSGQISSLTDTLGTTVTVTYNGDELPTQIVAGSGATQRQAQRTYTAAGYVDTETDAEERVYDFDYDALGRLTQATSPDSRDITFGYDVAGNTTSLTPPGRSAYTFEYNNVGQFSSAQYPAVPGGGSNQLSYSYDLDRRLAQITRADGINIDLIYDSAGRLETITQPDGDFSLSYGATTGLLDSIVSPDGVTMSNSFNNDLLTQVAWSGPVSGSIEYAFDAKGRITTFTIGGQDYTYAFNSDDDITQAGAQTLTYDAASGLLTGTSLGTVNETFAYSQFAELAQHTVTAGAITLYDVTYARDGLGRITQQIETVEGTTTTTNYTYDLAGRLETVTEDDTLVATYTYDSNDNRTDHGGVYDAQDRITAQIGINYSYNAQGERNQKTEGANTILYQYDALGTLHGATLSNGDQVDYLLDGQSRRVAKQVNGTVTEAWLYDANAVNIVARLNAANAITQRYIYASRLQVPDYIDAGATQYKVIADHLGSVRLIVNTSSGAVLQRIDYDTWGAINSDSNPNFQPFAFVGGHYDADTGLSRFGARDYDPVSTHWLSKDPIGFVGSISNLYAYVSADPVNNIDLLGTDKTSAGKALGDFSSAADMVGLTEAGGRLGPFGLAADIASRILDGERANNNYYDASVNASSDIATGLGGTGLLVGVVNAQIGPAAASASGLGPLGIVLAAGSAMIAANKTDVLTANRDRWSRIIIGDYFHEDTLVRPDCSGGPTATIGPRSAADQRSDRIAGPNTRIAAGLRY